MPGHKVATAIAATGDREKTLAALPTLNSACVSCHLAYRLRGLAVETNTTLAEVDAKLRASSGLDEKQRQDEAKAAEWEEAPAAASARRP